MVLYPTETIYALGVNALDEREVAELFAVKGREKGKAVSWLVRDIQDIRRWGEVGDNENRVVAKIAERFLPGSLTLVVPARDCVPRRLTALDGTISFRISSDPVAQRLIAEFMAEHDAPLTCTSANVSGLLTLPTVPEILAQFRQYHGHDISIDWGIYDDGPRTGAPSTVVRVVGNEVAIIREGAIPGDIILSFLGNR